MTWSEACLNHRNLERNIDKMYVAIRDPHHSFSFKKHTRFWSPFWPAFIALILLSPLGPMLSRDKSATVPSAGGETRTRSRQSRADTKGTSRSSSSQTRRSETCCPERRRRDEILVQINCQRSACGKDKLSLSWGTLNRKAICFRKANDFIHY